ncbi:Autophagy-related protein 9A [Halotydeus destructor]|nr:Autophagy-related protein 9A [Halotydeus destructor]
MYQSFTELGAGDEDPLSLHVLPSSRSSRPWQHYIHDLDYFFLRVYRYHRRHGLLCIVLNQCLELIQFVFVVVFTIFLIHGVNYDVMFKNGPYKPTANNTKVTIGQTLIPWTEFQLSGIEIFLLIFATVFWIFKCLKMMQSFAVNSAIKSFYKEALKIQDCTLYTWQAVQSKLIAAQRLCLIQDSHLNELDVHNRILRHRNYLIALINKGLIPLHYRVPLIGEMTYLSKGLLFNMEYLLFKGPLSLFECNWKLKDEVKSQSNRIAIANQLARNCLYLAAANLVLFPFVAVWQLLTTFFMYAESLKRDPSMVLGPRTWSLYARWYCRHFNELDHQLDDRLNRGYKDATKYMNSFTSPAVEIIARHVTFFAASILAVLICLTVYDEDVITVEHLITVMTALGAIIAVSRAFISP